MPSRPQVTVVIPSANRWDFVVRSTRCALEQQGVSVEVIVCSDGPRNPVPPQAPELADERVRVFQDPEPQGVCRARNLGLAEARGEWVAFLDDDDVWAPHKLRAQLDAIEAAQADFSYTSAIGLDADLRPLWVEDAAPADAIADRARVTSPFPAGASSILARTELVRRIGGFDPQLQHYGDWDVENALIHHGRPAPVVVPLVGYVAHADAMHIRLLEGIEREFAYFVEKQAGLGRPIDTRMSNRWIASGFRQAGRRGHAARWYLRSAVEHRAPGELLRAAGALLGERAMRAARPARARTPLAVPDWVRELRESSLAA